jgi:hypothetical protein
VVQVGRFALVLGSLSIVLAALHDHGLVPASLDWLMTLAGMSYLVSMFV